VKKILLAGYYGFGNLGDEAILEMVLKQLLGITDRNNITVLSGNKEETAKKYNIKTVDRYNVISIIKELRACDALVFGGGSLLQDVTSKRSIYYYLFLIRLASMMGNKVIMLSQGIGPIVNEKSKTATFRSLKRVNSISVRDIESKKFLESIGVAKNKIYLSSDPVIDFKTQESCKKEYYSVTCAKKVCFSLRNWKNTDVSERISKVAEKLIKNGIQCYFIPFYYNEDLGLVNEIEDLIGADGFYYKERLSTNEAFDIIRNMNVMVGARLHSLIFASAANVPFVAVSYDHKVDHFVKSVNMKVACSIENIDTDLLYDEIIKKLENELEEKKILVESVKKLRDINNVNYKILKEI